MIRRHVVVMAAGLLGAAVGAGAQQPSATGVVTLRVGVVSATGSFVPGLTREDFSVRVDGTPAEVRAVRVADPIPVLVLVDVTVSAVGAADELRSPLNSHVLGAVPQGTPVRVASFGRTLHAPGGWSTDRRTQERQLRNALDVPAAERHGPSPVWDVIDDSLRTLLPAEGRAGIVLVTDGQTSGNRVRLSVPADRAMSMGVPISVVFVGAMGRLGQRDQMTAVVRPDRALEQLAAATGGALFNRSTTQRQAWDGGPGGDPLRRAAVSLSEVYTLDVVVPAKTGFQSVSVTTRDSSHRVRVRMGLTAPHQPSPDGARR